MRSMLSFCAISGRSLDGRRVRAPAVVLVEAELLCEDPQRGPHESGGPIRVPAGAAARQLVAPACHTLEVVMVRRAAGQAPGGLGDGGQAEHTGTALAGARA